MGGGLGEGGAVRRTEVWIYRFILELIYMGRLSSLHGIYMGRLFMSVAYMISRHMVDTIQLMISLQTCFENDRVMLWPILPKRSDL